MWHLLCYLGSRRCTWPRRRIESLTGNASASFRRCRKGVGGYLADFGGSWKIPLSSIPLSYGERRVISVLLATPNGAKDCSAVFQKSALRLECVSFFFSSTSKVALMSSLQVHSASPFSTRWKVSALPFVSGDSSRRLAYSF